LSAGRGRVFEAFVTRHIILGLGACRLDPRRPVDSFAYTAAGKTVFVDFTADWGMTCKANEAAAINKQATKQLVEANDVITLKADKTQPAPEVDELLQRLGNKAGSIPFYAVFPAGNPNTPILLDGMFTSPQPILDALEKAGPSRRSDAQDVSVTATPALDATDVRS